MTNISDKLHPNVKALIAACGARIYGFSEAIGIGIQLSFFEMLAYGIYRQDHDLILIRETAPHQNLTALHELVHWSGISGRSERPVMLQSRACALDYSDGRPVSWRPTAEEIATEEMTAQYGMFYLALALGLDSIEARIELDQYASRFQSANMAQAENDGRLAANWLLGFGLAQLAA